MGNARLQGHPWPTCDSGPSTWRHGEPWVGSLHHGGRVTQPLRHSQGQVPLLGAAAGTGGQGTALPQGTETPPHPTPVVTLPPGHEGSTSPLTASPQRGCLHMPTSTCPRKPLSPFCPPHHPMRSRKHCPQQPWVVTFGTETGQGRTWDAPAPGSLHAPPQSLDTSSCLQPLMTLK